MALESKDKDFTNKHLNNFRKNPQDTNVLFDSKNGFNSKYFSESPTFLSYSLFFDFSSPFLNKPDSFGESAERYFTRLRDTKRADMVVEFRDRLFHLIENTPYMLKDISGLDNLLDYSRKEIYLERSLKINCYETLDLRIDNLSLLYTNIVWDWDKMKKTLPSNLEWIDFGIIITDFRDLVKYIDEDKTSIKPHLSARSYYFKNSKFDFKSSGFSSLNRTVLDVSGNSFSITCGKFDNRSYIINTHNTSGEIKSVSEDLEKAKVTNISPMTVGKPKQYQTMTENNDAPTNQTTTKLKAGAKLLLKSGLDTASSLAKQEVDNVKQRLIDIAKAKAFAMTNRNILFSNERNTIVDVANNIASNAIKGNLANNLKEKINGSLDNYTGVVVDNILNKRKIGDKPLPERETKKLLPSSEDVINKTIGNINSIIRKKLLK